MGLNCGIIGLPNVGKSTIFNALSCAGAQMANYPFCTIEPNRGIVQVPDSRLTEIAMILGKTSPIPTKMEFIDVAGLVEGASKGEGLGNTFLGHIRQVDAIIQIVRCFDDDDVIHVSGSVDPVRDMDIINTELLLADMEVLERGREKAVKGTRSGDRDARKKVDLIDSMMAHLNEGRFLREMEMGDETALAAAEFGLITNKPMLYCANTAEGKDPSDYIKAMKKHAGVPDVLTICGKVEEEISELPGNEKREYLEAMGMSESGLDRLVVASYRLLNLITFYSSATDLQAWAVRSGTKAPRAAGAIHTDFERGFIRAEVMNSRDLLALGSEQSVREQGLLRSEGREYVVKDGDIIRFLFNV